MDDTRSSQNRRMHWREARGLLAEAVGLNLRAKRSAGTSPSSEERDGILADLAAEGYPVNVDDYAHPSDVRQPCMWVDPHNPRGSISSREAQDGFSEAVRLNQFAQRYPDSAEALTERDKILRNLRAAGYPTNVDDYTDPEAVYRPGAWAHDC